jgi:hypothetical protein
MRVGLTGRIERVSGISEHFRPNCAAAKRAPFGNGERHRENGQGDATYGGRVGLQWTR